MLVTTCLCVQSSWYEYVWLEIINPGNAAQACRHLWCEQYWVCSACCIILCGKLKEAATGYKSHVHCGGTCDPSCPIWYN